METIRELEIRCQHPRRNTDDWYMMNILRKVSVRITWLLLHTPISANGVTLTFIVTGFVICGVFLFATKPAFLIGAIGLQFWYTLDMVDGEIARYRDQMGATGRFFDYMAHYIVHPWFFMSIGFGLYLRYGIFWVFLLSIAAGYSAHLIDAFLDVHYSVLYKRLRGRLLEPAKPVVFKKMESSRDEKNAASPLKKCFSGLHYVCTFPAIIYFMLPVSILNFFVRSEIFIPWIVFYSFAATLVWMSRVTVYIKKNKIDAEYSKLDEALNSFSG
ncbi:MAG: CDP-alcohol phosphatidyltransferase family protein [Candidatus Omnitrophica bacterium]|nr:CDP-alcohol phosphatidyltransferase family protein [Candidatus Omnitrophota bacterium]